MTPAVRPLWMRQIVTTPGEIRTLLADQGVYLSEGQREELAIALRRMSLEPRLRYSIMVKARRASGLPRPLVEMDWIYPPVLSDRPLLKGGVVE